MKKSTIFFSIIFLFFIALWFASPYWTLYKIKQAVDQNNAEQLSQYIDYPSVRQSLKPQIQQQINHKLGIDHSQNQIAIWGAVVSEKLTDRLIDVVIDPQSIRLLMQGKALKESVSLPSVEETSTVSKWFNKVQNYLGHDVEKGNHFTNVDTQHSVHIEEKMQNNPISANTNNPKNISDKPQAHYLNMNQFEVIITNDAGQPTHFIMQRHGFNWKVIKILINVF